MTDNGQAQVDSFVASEAGGRPQGGGIALVEAYAIIWVVLLASVVGAFRRQRRLALRIETIEKRLDAVRPRS